MKVRIIIFVQLLTLAISVSGQIFHYRSTAFMPAGEQLTAFGTTSNTMFNQFKVGISSVNYNGLHVRTHQSECYGFGILSSVTNPCTKAFVVHNISNNQHVFVVYGNGEVISEKLRTKSNTVSNFIGSNFIGQYSDNNHIGNIQDFTQPIEKLFKLKGKTFDFSPNSSFVAEELRVGKWGLIGQEVQSNFPNLVKEMDIPDTSTTPIETKVLAVDYTQIVPLLVEGIKAQQVMISDLNNKILNMESNMDMLNGQIEYLLSISSISTDSLNLIINPYNGFSMAQSIPNPANGSFTVSYTLPETNESPVSIKFWKYFPSASNQPDLIFPIVNISESDSITVPANTLGSGYYIYKLYVEDTPVCSRTLVIAN